MVTADGSSGLLAGPVQGRVAERREEPVRTPCSRCVSRSV